MTEKDMRSIELDKVLVTLQDYARCNEGKERLAALRPSTDIEEVRSELAKTNAMAALLQQLSNPRYGDAEGALPAVGRAAKGGLLSMGELLKVMHALQNFRELRAFFGDGGDEGIPLEELFYALSPQPGLEESIRRSIISETEMADTASDALYTIRRQIRSAESSIRDRLDSMIRASSTQKYLQDSVVTMRSGRFVVPVKAEFRGEIPGTIHDVSASGATLFVEPAVVVEANARIMQLKNSEAAEIERILEAFTDQVARLSGTFSYSYDAMLEIDCVIARAKLGLAQRAFIPAVDEGFRFQLHAARHPLISRDKVVPIDVSIGYDYDCLIVTGPNTGGKTVTLKTAGLLCAMACCGLLIPAAPDSTVCVFGNILADIGDEQSIEQSLSTFSGHMRNITAILQVADESSLVLLDELGAGTDPAEGAALAVAIIEELRRRGAKLMATTHYAELKVYALDADRVQNASCEFDIATLQPTYRLSVGVPGRSNAFAIGEKLGLPAKVIEAAQGHLSSEDKRFESVLVQLDDIKKELASSRAETEELRQTAANALASAAKERDALVKQGEEELEAAREKAKALLRQVQDDAYRLTDEMRALQKQENRTAQEKAQRARQIARQDTDSLLSAIGEGKAEPRIYPPLTSARVGDRVVITALAREATVVKAPDKSGMVEVKSGSVRTKLRLSDLHKASLGGAKAGPVTRPMRKATAEGGAPVARTPGMEINLLGLSVEEAIFEADKFIDQAVLSGFETVYLIHGVGTGALRAGIQAHLKGHKSVKSFRLGRYGEGEAGVTVVELK